jgi:hypothetical protein
VYEALLQEEGLSIRVVASEIRPVGIHLNGGSPANLIGSATIEDVILVNMRMDLDLIFVIAHQIHLEDFLVGTFLQMLDETLKHRRGWSHDLVEIIHESHRIGDLSACVSYRHIFPVLETGSAIPLQVLPRQPQEHLGETLVVPLRVTAT